MDPSLPWFPILEKRTPQNWVVTLSLSGVSTEMDAATMKLTMRPGPRKAAVSFPLNFYITILLHHKGSFRTDPMHNPWQHHSHDSHRMASFTQAPMLLLVDNNNKQTQRPAARQRRAGHTAHHQSDQTQQEMRIEAIKSAVSDESERAAAAHQHINSLVMLAIQQKYRRATESVMWCGELAVPDGSVTSWDLDLVTTAHRRRVAQISFLATSIPVFSHLGRLLHVDISHSHYQN